MDEDDLSRPYAFFACIGPANICPPFDEHINALVRNQSSEFAHQIAEAELDEEVDEDDLSRRGPATLAAAADLNGKTLPSACKQAAFFVCQYLVSVAHHTIGLELDDEARA